MKTLEQLLRGHKFFQDLKPDYVALLVGCATMPGSPNGPSCCEGE
jgi:hypothetical protein